MGFSSSECESNIPPGQLPGNSKNMTTDSIISKVWSFCHTLRDDGVGYGDYLGNS